MNFFGSLLLSAEYATSAIMKSASQILSDHKIKCSTAKSKTRALCPQCSFSRHTKMGRRAKCLSVAIDSKGVRWNCWHCDWKGGEFYDEYPRTERGTHQGDRRSGDQR